MTTTKKDQWEVTAAKILTKEEVQKVLAELQRKSRRSLNTRTNLILFRLATCCGLRASELTRITLDNVRVDSDSPKIRVPKTVGKGGKARVVPLTFDAGTLADIREWKAFRESQGATGTDLFICSQHKDSLGNQIDRQNARLRYKAACKVLGKERCSEITIHHGRHSFISHALHNGYNIQTVRTAAGHSNLATTSLYSHLLADSDKVGNMFGDKTGS
jgi:integrase/recombinase XerD